MADIATWIGAVGGAGGMIAGSVALVYAHIGKRAAQESGELARSVEESAREAVGLARESNGIAVDAKQLAEEANSIAARSEARDTERNDVHWQLDWKDPGAFELINAGRDEALNVHAVVRVDDWEQVQTAESVPGGGRLAFFLPEARQEFLCEVAKRRARRVAHQQSAFMAPAAAWESPAEFLHSVSRRVSWETPLGKQCVHDPKPALSNLGDHGAAL